MEFFLSSQLYYCLFVHSDRLEAIEGKIGGIKELGTGKFEMYSINCIALRSSQMLEN